eukprot:158997-Rhodomonas_salina.1
MKVYHKKWYEHGDKKMAVGGRLQYWVRKRTEASMADEVVEEAAPTLDLGGVGNDLPYKYMQGDWEWYHSCQAGCTGNGPTTGQGKSQTARWSGRTACTRTWGERKASGW